jgi:2-haloacid dehalogenase
MTIFNTLSSSKIRSVVFDLGGVLVDWDPRYLYQELISDCEQREWFLRECCSREWILEQDLGRPWAEGNALLIKRHPAHRTHIEAFRERWLEMLRGTITESVSVLSRLHQCKVPLYALSNWAADTFALSAERLPFLDLFSGVLISGEVGVRKPDPRIFQLLGERYGVEPETSVFIDDTRENVEAARALGFDTIHCTSPSVLRDELTRRGLLGSQRSR